MSDFFHRAVDFVVHPNQHIHQQIHDQDTTAKHAQNQQDFHMDEDRKGFQPPTHSKPVSMDQNLTNLSNNFQPSTPSPHHYTSSSFPYPTSYKDIVAPPTPSHSPNSFVRPISSYPPYAYIPTADGQTPSHLQNFHSPPFPHQSICYIPQQQLPVSYQTLRPPNENQPKPSLRDFTLVQTIGTGTFGRVFLAKFKYNSSFYAMKVLKKVDVVRLKQVEHINSEREILSQVHHPFIVNLFCTFQNETNVFMLMEYVIGGELFSHLRRAGRFANDVTRFYAAEIGLAIEYLHSKDIIYRDLKPENLLLDSMGHVKITDFGFAKRVEDRTWTLCGTPEYLAPEIIQSKGHGKAVDWWALGILIFEMLAGYPPFFDDNPFGIYEKILAGRVHFPSHFDPIAKDLIKRLLTADRSRRLGNLKDGSEDIKRHKWFKGVDWNALITRQVRAPIIPPTQHPGDTSNFERYPEPKPEELAGIYATGKSGIDGADPFGHLFTAF